MSEQFDPYAEWLEIPIERRPPTFYDLLGVDEDEEDVEEIEDCFQERYAQVRRYQVGEHSEQAVRILQEISKAYDCLSDDAARERYDQALHPPQEEFELAEDDDDDFEETEEEREAVAALTIQPAAAAATTPPTAGADAPAPVEEMVWYVQTPTGQRLGPASDSQLREVVEQRHINPHSRIWRVGWTRAVPATQLFPELAAGLAPQPAETQPAETQPAETQPAAPHPADPLAPAHAATSPQASAYSPSTAPAAPAAPVGIPPYDPLRIGEEQRYRRGARFWRLALLGAVLAGVTLLFQVAWGGLLFSMLAVGAIGVVCLAGGLLELPALLNSNLVSRLRARWGDEPTRRVLVRSGGLLVASSYLTVLVLIYLHFAPAVWSLMNVAQPTPYDWDAKTDAPRITSLDHYEWKELEWVPVTGENLARVEKVFLSQPGKARAAEFRNAEAQRLEIEVPLEARLAKPNQTVLELHSPQGIALALPNKLVEINGESEAQPDGTVVRIKSKATLRGAIRCIVILEPHAKLLQAQSCRIFALHENQVGKRSHTNIVIGPDSTAVGEGETNTRVLTPRIEIHTLPQPLVIR